MLASSASPWVKPLCTLPIFLGSQLAVTCRAGESQPPREPSGAAPAQVGGMQALKVDGGMGDRSQQLVRC